MADEIYRIAQFTETCTMKGHIDWRQSTGPRFYGDFDEETADVFYHIGTEQEIIDDNLETLRIHQDVSGPAAHFRRRCAIVILEFFDAVPGDEDEDEGE
jgi:hypothetical protein